MRKLGAAFSTSTANSLCVSFLLQAIDRHNRCRSHVQYRHVVCVQTGNKAMINDKPKQFTASETVSTRDSVDLSTKLSVMTEQTPTNSDSEKTDTAPATEAADPKANHMGGPLRAIRPHLSLIHI